MTRETSTGHCGFFDGAGGIVTFFIFGRAVDLAAGFPFTFLCPMAGGACRGEVSHVETSVNGV